MRTSENILLIRSGLVLLILALLFGVLAAFSFVYADTLGKYLPFVQLRPLHVSSAVFWILTTSSSGILYYSQRISSKKQQLILGPVYLITWCLTIISILSCFLLGKFGGREYWEFPPILALPLLAAWIMFAILFFNNVKQEPRGWPVYYWMWSTGVFFFVITYLEANLWIFPWFRNNVIRDITIQWKSNGSLVGSWNMLIYGTSLYLMSLISGDQSPARSQKAFFFYFLGLVNLLFNWGHHTYILPQAPWIRDVSYAISMTEWIIFLNIIRNWRKTLGDAKKHSYLIPFQFLLASEFWVFANLILALLMSIPAINIYTHGTHVTVAHAMGTTIGINTMILLASVSYIFSRQKEWNKSQKHWLIIGFWISNISLLIFWLSLIIAGIIKGYYTIHVRESSFNDIMQNIHPYLTVFAFAGIGLMAGLALIATILLWKKNAES